MAFDRRRAGELSLDQVDGFLAAIAVGPELIMPSEWLPVIWGDGEPEYEGLEETQQILYAIMARYNQILDMTRRDPEAYQPILATMGDGGIAASQWAAGFMSGVALRRSAWEPLIESEEDQGLVAPIVALLRDEHGRPMIESEGEELAAVRRSPRSCSGLRSSPSTASGRLAGGCPRRRPRSVATIPVRADRAASTSAAAAQASATSPTFLIEPGPVKFSPPHDRLQLHVPGEAQQPTSLSSR